MHWAEALIAGIVGAAVLAAARLRRLIPGVAVYIPFYMICRGWWRVDSRPLLAICTLLSVILVLPAMRQRVSVPRPVLWSVLGVMLAAGVSLALGVALDVGANGVLRAAVVTGVGFGAYLVASTLGADLRGRLGLMGAAALLLLLGATSWHARIVVTALRRPGAPPHVLSRVRTLNDRLRLPGLTLRAGRAEVESWLEVGDVEKARTVSGDLVRMYAAESEPAVLHARVLRESGDSTALEWVASATGGPLSDEDRTYVARELIRAGWVGPWAAAWQSLWV